MTSQPDPEFTGLLSTSGVSAFTGEPFVLLEWHGPMSGQMTPDEARQLGLHIIEAADAAVTDSLVIAELKSIGLKDEPAAVFLQRVRTRRGES